MSRSPVLVCVLAMSLLPTAGSADIVRLTTGGEIRGMIVGEDGVDPSREDNRAVTIETLSGGLISVSRDEVAAITRRPRIIEEYETRAKATPSTAQAQWELAEWCRAHELDEQRHEHLMRVVELDRNHADARQALGQTQFQGEWMTKEEMMQERGLVEYRGRWITPEELDLIQKSDAEKEREEAWYTRMRRLRRWLRGGSDEYRRKAVKQLREIRDVDAVPALEKAFRDDPEPEVRAFYVAILADIPGDKPVRPLVTQALHDVSREVRKAANEAIDESRYKAALPYFLQGLRSDSNVVVRRAGRGIERVGDDRAVPDLIKALITTHRHQVSVLESSPVVSFNGGTFGAGGTPLPPSVAGALQTGGLPHGVRVVDPTTPLRRRIVTISVNKENPEVLSALQKITGESFGFDERTWGLWWAAKKNGTG